MAGWPVPILTSIIVVLPDNLGIVDVLFNAIAVIWIDRLLSSTYTPSKYFLTFIVGGVAGNLLSLLNGPGFASFGASGGIFALIAGVVSYDYATNRTFNTTLVIWFVLVLAYSSLGGSVDVLAHLGGALVGLLLGFAYHLTEARRSEELSFRP